MYVIIYISYGLKKLFLIMLAFGKSNKFPFYTLRGTPIIAFRSHSQSDIFLLINLEIKYDKNILITLRTLS